jgi:hypothetical protein
LAYTVGIWQTEKGNDNEVCQHETMRFGEMGVEVIARIEVKRFTGSDSPSGSAVEPPACGKPLGRV